MSDIKLGQRVYVGGEEYRIMAKNGNGTLFLMPIKDGLRDKTRDMTQVTAEEIELITDGLVNSLAVAIGAQTAIDMSWGEQ